LKVLCAFALIVAVVFAAEENNEKDLQPAEGFLGAYGGYGHGLGYGGYG
jgi:hypothetical protein